MARPIGFRTKKDERTGKKTVYPILRRTGRVNWNIGPPQSRPVQKSELTPIEVIGDLMIMKKYIKKDIYHNKDGTTNTYLEPVIIGKRKNDRKLKKFTPAWDETWSDLTHTYVKPGDIVDFSNAPIVVSEVDLNTGELRSYKEPPEPYKTYGGRLSKEGDPRPAERAKREKEEAERRAKAKVYRMPFGYEVNELDLNQGMPKDFAKMWLSTIPIQIIGDPNRQPSFNEAYIGRGTIHSITDYGEWKDMVRQQGEDALIEKVRKELAERPPSWLAVWNKPQGKLADGIAINVHRSGYSVVPMFKGKEDDVYVPDMDRIDSSLAKTGSAWRSGIDAWKRNNAFFSDL